MSAMALSQESASCFTALVRSAESGLLIKMFASCRYISPTGPVPRVLVRILFRAAAAWSYTPHLSDATPRGAMVMKNGST